MPRVYETVTFMCKHCSLAWSGLLKKAKRCPECNSSEVGVMMLDDFDDGIDHYDDNVPDEDE